MLYELLYSSAAAVKFDDNTILYLLQEAREKNTHQNITGLLVYHGREFAQILEGEKEDVLSTFEKIRMDERHTSVNVIWQNSVESRSFTDWRMAFVHTEDMPSDPDTIPGALTGLDKDALLEDICRTAPWNTGSTLFSSISSQLLDRKL